MALNPKRTNAVVTTLCDTMAALCNGGTLNIYDGTQAATADTAVGAQVLLAQLTFGSPAFAGSVNGVATANAITADSSANATGTASWFRVKKSDGTTVVYDGSVGTATADLILNTVSIVLGASVSVTSLTLTESK